MSKRYIVTLALTHRSASLADQRLDRIAKANIIEPAHKRYRTATLAEATTAVEKLFGDVDRKAVMTAAQWTGADKLTTASLQNEAARDGDVGEADCLRPINVGGVEAVARVV